MAELTTVQVLCNALKRFEYLEDFEREAVVAYFECPNYANCELDTVEGLTMHEREHTCSACKVRWLLSKWEG